MRIGIDIGIESETKSGNSSSNQLAYAWASGISPIIMTTVSISKNVNAVITNAQAAFLSPTFSGSSAVSVVINDIVATGQQSALSPTVSAIKNVSVSALIVNAQADGFTPSISTGTSVSVSITSVVSSVTASAGVDAVTVSTTHSGIIDEDGLWANHTLDEDGNIVFANGLNEQGRKVFF